jgi:ABC-type Mn2+/Zn2+ transport system ATPase subunit
MADPLVEFSNISYRYGHQVVLESINLHIHYGQFIGILGPSGAGKTTLLKLILGLLKPASGIIHYGKANVRIGYVPQIEVADRNFPVTVEQVVLMGRSAKTAKVPWYTKQEREKAYTLMSQLGIADLGKRHIRDLSGGQQQRVFLARALNADPDMLVLDEPTARVDYRTQEDILHLLADLNAQGITLVMTTHDLNATASHIPWVVFLNRSVVAQGTPDDAFTADILNRTYKGDMIVVKQDGLIFVQERPHWHTHKDIAPDPVLSHPDPTISPNTSLDNPDNSEMPVQIAMTPGSQSDTATEVRRD